MKIHTTEMVYDTVLAVCIFIVSRTNLFIVFLGYLALFNKIPIPKIFTQHRRHKIKSAIINLSGAWKIAYRSFEEFNNNGNELASAKAIYSTLVYHEKKYTKERSPDFQEAEKFLMMRAIDHPLPDEFTESVSNYESTHSKYGCPSIWKVMSFRNYVLELRQEINKKHKPDDNMLLLLLWTYFYLLHCKKEMHKQYESVVQDFQKTEIQKSSYLYNASPFTLAIVACAHVQINARREALAALIKAMRYIEEHSYVNTFV
jgi:hypothetical protein